jgi:LPXTG-motif cell wall-anchored protein
MPAITMETPQCGLEEHTHGSDCYESTLVCTQEESGHTHGDGCYTVTTTRELTCSQEEGGGHTHGSGCYSTETEEVEKTGTRTETVQTGSQTVVDEVDEEGNVVSSHEEPIYEEQEVEYTYTETVEREVLTCTESEGGGHTHDDSCYTETEHRELTCTEEETGHTHGEDCYEKTQICELEEHTHDASCYPEDGEGEDVPPVDGEEGEDVPPVDGEEGEDVPPVDGGEGEDVPPVDGGEGEDVPPVDGGEGEETPPAETMKPVRVDEEGYILDENGERVLDENGEPIKAEAVAPVEKPEELPEEVTPPENIGAVRVDEEGYILDENGERVLDENGQPILVEIPDVEVPKTLMMTVLPAGAEVPENYTETYNYVDSEGEYAVTVFAPEGAVPAGAELSATVMWGVRVEAEDGGVVPMDIHFELDGEEIEPVLPVYVVINVENLIPDDADPESVEIQHYKGTDYNAADAVQISALAAGIHLDSGIMALDLDGESAVMDEAPGMELPEDVEVVANSKAGTGDIDVNSDTLKAAFEVGEFSYFTITYKNYTYTPSKLTVRLVDTNGNELGTTNQNLGNYNITDTEWHQIKDIVASMGHSTYTVNGQQYQYLSAYVTGSTKDSNGNITDNVQRAVVSVKMLETASWWSTNYDWQYENGTTEDLEGKYVENSITELALVYQKVNESKSNTDVYFYLLKSSDNVQVNTFVPSWKGAIENGNWYYAGKVSTDAIGDPKDYRIGYYCGYDEVKPAVEPAEMPTIEGMTYNSNPNGGKNTYRVSWVRYIDSNGAWYGTPGSVQSGDSQIVNVPAWHVDGFIIQNDDQQFTVTYHLVDESGNVIGNILGTQLVKRGQKADGSKITVTIPDGYEAIDNKTYNWYNDPNCADGTKYNFDPVTANIDLYTPVKKIPATFTLDLLKCAGYKETDSDGKEVMIFDEEVPLGNAEFVIEEIEGSNKTTGTVGDNLGRISWEGLEYGKEYTLKEVNAPNGYNMLPGTITFTVNADGATSLSGDAAKYAEFDTTNGILLKVANVGGYVLPSTGGEGIYWYTWSGAMLMMAAAFTLMYKKSYRREGLED